MSTPSPQRRVLVLAHTGRAEVREVARACVQSLTAHGIAVRLLADEAADLGLTDIDGLVETTHPDDTPGEGCELVLVIGGDGSILRRRGRYGDDGRSGQSHRQRQPAHTRKSLH